MISRRAAFIFSLSVGLVAASLAAKAQPSVSSPRIGWLGTPGRAANADFIRGFSEALRQLGYADGRIGVEYRFADGRAERLPGLAGELVNLPVDAIIVAGSQATTAAKRATATIPIVMVSVGDPVGTGLVASLAKPGGNVTGLSAAHDDIAVKWLDLFREVVPKASRFGCLEDPSQPEDRGAHVSAIGAPASRPRRRLSDSCRDDHGCAALERTLQLIALQRRR